MVDGRLHEGEIQADEALIRRLLADQHPDLAALTIRRIASTGTDHAVFRLGDDLVVRMPRIGWAEQQVEREARWLPVLAPRLSVDIPVPVAIGESGHGYPFRWLVSPWLDGTDLLGAMTDGTELDDVVIARDLAAFLRDLQAIEPEGGPQPGKRGRDLAVCTTSGCGRASPSWPTSSTSTGRSSGGTLPSPPTR